MPRSLIAAWRLSRKPPVVDELASRIRLTFDRQHVPAVSSVDHLTGETPGPSWWKNYAAYLAECGEPA
ncbi:hypothetical protein [Streptomyces sp. NPDC101234]|uniref:hypothetical protein n=1 Tax=Streptomyces sp. NPDC101234 TaxID=3366138 RepID=UPI0037FEFE07